MIIIKLFHLEEPRNEVVFMTLESQARKIHFNIWSSEDHQDSKFGRPQLFVVVLRCISFAEQ